MDMKIPAIAITASIVVIVMATVLMPILSDATETETTFTNEGYYTLEKYSADDSVTVSWDHTDPTVITVNDEDYTVNSPTGQWVSVIVGDDWYLRYIHTAANLVELQMSYGGAARISASTTNGYDISVVCTGGTATGTTSNSGSTVDTKTASYTDLYVISDSGEYFIMKDASVPASMMKDSEFLGVGQTSINGGAAVIKVEGSIEDGATVTLVGSTVTANVDTDTVAVNATAKEGYIDCYDLSSITFDIITDGGTTHATYSYFIVPLEVTAEKSVHLDSNEIALLAAIPIMLIVALIIGIMALVLRSRMD